MTLLPTNQTKPHPDDLIPYDAKEFGARLRKLRKQARRTQAQLGQDVRLSADAIGSYETGRSRPTEDTLADFATTFGVSRDKLVEGLPPYKGHGGDHRGGTHLNGENKRRLLTKLVLEADKRQTLYVAAGDASFLYVWLVELYSESSTTPRIDCVRVLHASDEELKRQTVLGTIEPELQQRLRINIKSVRRLLKREGVKVETFVLDRLPRFHGFQYGDDLLFDTWKMDKSKKLHGRSHLTRTKRGSEPKAFREFEAEFAAARQVKPASNDSSAKSTSKPKLEVKNANVVAKNKAIAPASKESASAAKNEGKPKRKRQAT